MADSTLVDNMTPKEYGRAYYKAKAVALAGKVPAERPRAIILAGQPGAGKSILREQAARELADRGGAVVVDPDELRPYHPRYPEHARADYRTAADKVHPDATRLADDLRRDATKGRYNLVIDGTLKSPENAVRLCEELKAARYEVDVRALAVNPRISERGVDLRKERALADVSGKDIPRDVPASVQRLAVEGMPDSIARIEQTGVANSISVCQRGSSTPLYVNEGSVRVGGPDARAAIRAEQQRPLTSIEKRQAAEEADAIERLSSRPDRHAPAEELTRYEALRAEAHSQVRADPVAYAEYGERWGRRVTECHQALAEGRQARDYDPAARARFGEKSHEMEQHVKDAARDKILLDHIPDESVAKDVRDRVTRWEAQVQGGSPARATPELQPG